MNILEHREYLFGNIAPKIQLQIARIAIKHEDSNQIPRSARRSL